MAANDLRKLFIMRHAERVDFTFGEWIPSAFDHQGNYIRKNLNMPVSVPKRSGGQGDFHKDCPLTNIGLYQATLIGEAMKEYGVKFAHVFCSPSLRCIETCTNVLKASDQSHIIINVEPGLFEWLAWHQGDMPKWMSLDEYRCIGYNVSLDYEPVISESVINASRESCEEYYKRSHLVTTKILEKFCDGNILLLGHGATLDSCSRQLIGKAPRKSQTMKHLVPRIPYASIVVVEEKDSNIWELANPPFPALEHCKNPSFKLEMLTS